MDENEVNIIKDSVRVKNYLKGQYIVQSGDICRYQSYILTGIVRTFYLDKRGSEHIVTFGMENWWVGDLGSFITQSAADYDVQCLENTQVIQVTYEALEELYQKVPLLERFFRQVVQSAYVNTQKRVMQNYSRTASERYVQFCESYPVIVQRVPQYMIASYLGITKEFLSSIRKQANK